MTTLKELAEDTGFSITTISRVLSDDPTMSVPDSTRTAILEAAGRLHYKEDAVPRSRRVRKTRETGLRFGLAEMLSPAEQLDDPYYLYLRTYAQQQCRDSGHVLLPVSAAAGAPQPPRRLDGVLAVGVFDAGEIQRLARLSRNLVFLDSSPDELRFDSVVLDFRLGTEQALDALTDMGHRRIGFLGPDRKLDQRRRPAPEVLRQCYVSYMRRRELYDPALLLETAPDAAAARVSVARLLAGRTPRPTALLAANEETAIGAVRALREGGLRVPQDVSVISFNDTPRSVLTDPPLTSVSTHADVMSAAAVELLARRAEIPMRLPLKLVVPPTLIRRESSCPPPVCR